MITWFKEDPVRILIYLVPFLMVFVYALLLYIPSTKDFTLSLRGENNPIEILTFLALFAASLYGIYVIKYVARVIANSWFTLAHFLLLWKKLPGINGFLVLKHLLHLLK